ncbi:hypothetical protein VP01_2321g1 [Puccinia sorghi]|uniref:Uncharacterized protein n=1 Tax=Puccinia sorghi TaxID=27349 RepID=A0A0L6V7J4_9BASI|nr:hypothetical protein VP01_2321g1 [Puccinia sorghi]
MAYYENQSALSNPHSSKASFRSHKPDQLMPQKIVADSRPPATTSTFDSMPANSCPSSQKLGLSFFRSANYDGQTSSKCQDTIETDDDEMGSNGSVHSGEEEQSFGSKGDVTLGSEDTLTTKDKDAEEELLGDKEDQLSTDFELEEDGLASESDSAAEDNNNKF